MDRPTVELTATEVISDDQGTMLRSPYLINYRGYYASTDEVARIIRQGFDLNVSTDWVVKVTD